MTSWADQVEIDEDIIMLGEDVPHHRLLPRNNVQRIYDNPEDIKRAEVRDWIASFPQTRTLWQSILLSSKDRYDDQYNYLGINISSQKRRQNLFDWYIVDYSKKNKTKYVPELEDF